MTKLLLVWVVVCSVITGSIPFMHPNIYERRTLIFKRDIWFESYEDAYYTRNFVLGGWRHINLSLIQESNITEVPNGAFSWRLTYKAYEINQIRDYMVIVAIVMFDITLFSVATITSLMYLRGKAKIKKRMET